MMRSTICLALGLSLAGPSIDAQERVSGDLSLEGALDVALRNSPTFLRARNDEALAEWDVRQAWGTLMPSASASSSVSWQGPGEQQFGTLTLGDLGFGGQPSYYLSSYRLGLSYSLSLRSILGPSQAKAQQGATVAQIQVAESDLVSAVTTAYLEALRQQEAVRVAEQELESAQFNLRLAQGQLEVGSVTPIDVGLAEVQVGRAQVAVLQARNAFETARMRLLQQMGVEVDQNVALTTSFAVTEPPWEFGELQEMALDANPALAAGRMSSEAAGIGVRSARSDYLPTLGLSTGWSGFTREASSTDFQVAQAEAQVAGAVAQCVTTNDLYGRLANPLPPLDCSRFVFTDAQRQAIIDGNNQFPFGFVKSPPSVSLTLSVPIFQGLSRQRNVEAARLQHDDLVLQVREQEMALRADISIALANLRTAYESARLEERNQQLAEQQLRLARERYQLGAITFVELVDAQTLAAQADRDQIASVFAYQDAVTSLEALVGAPLRN